MLPAIKRKMYLPDLTDQLFGRDFLTSMFSDGADYTIPAVNIMDTESGFQLEMAVPGLRKEDISIKLEKDLLTVSSEKKSDQHDKTGDYTRREFSFSSFSRTFTIPETVNTDKISASHENGILQINLPKHKEETSRKNKSIKIS